MNIIFDSQRFPIDQWQQAFSQVDPAIRLLAPDSIADTDIDVLLLWQPARTDWSQASNLRLAFFLGAGIDVSQGNITLPEDVLRSHFKDAGMKRAMCDYASYALMHYQRRFDHFRQFQQEKHWELHRAYRTSDTMHVGVLGLGSLGSAVASHIATLGYQVSGWSRSPKRIDNVDCLYGGETLESLLKRSEILINMLPDTPQTKHLLNAQTLKMLPQDAALISLSRGSIIDTQALLKLLDNNFLRGAFMDVFEHEPLATDSPLWHHPKITITPHQSAPTQALDGAREIVAALAKL